MPFENENIEFKSQMVDDLYKEVIAFANTDGGMIYIGIDNQGNVVGFMMLMKPTRKSLTASATPSCRM